MSEENWQLANWDRWLLEEEAPELFEQLRNLEKQKMQGEETLRPRWAELRSRTETLKKQHLARKEKEALENYQKEATSLLEAAKKDPVGTLLNWNNACEEYRKARERLFRVQRSLECKNTIIDDPATEWRMEALTKGHGEKISEAIFSMAGRSAPQASVLAVVGNISPLDLLVAYRHHGNDIYLYPPGFIEEGRAQEEVDVKGLSCQVTETAAVLYSGGGYKTLKKALQAAMLLEKQET